MKHASFFLIILTALAMNSAPLRAEPEALELRIKGHRYYPELLEVKAGERFKIRITNEDPSSEEFESKSLIIEKFIGPKRTITVTLGPLKPGSYDFFGCFHPQTAKGQIVAK